MAREVDEPPAGQVSTAPDLMPPGEVIDRLLAESALFRLRAAQGQLGLADRQDPRPSARHACGCPELGRRP